MRSHFRVVLLCGAVTLSGCHRGPVITPSSDWHVAVTPDSALAFRVPPGYRERNAHGCWARSDERWPGSADFCVRLTYPLAAVAQGRAWEAAVCRGPESTVMDGSCYEEQRVDTVTFAGRTAIIRRALLSGTIGHYRRLPAILVVVSLGPADVAVLEGKHREPGTVDELVAIAGTVRLRPERRAVSAR